MFFSADAFFKALISLIPDLPKTLDVADSKSRTSEPFLIDFLYGFISTLLVTPVRLAHWFLSNYSQSAFVISVYYIPYERIDREYIDNKV